MAPFRFQSIWQRIVEVGWTGHYLTFNVFAQRQYLPDAEGEVGPIPSQTIVFTGVPNLGEHDMLAGGGGTLEGYKVLSDGSIVPFTYGLPGSPIPPPEGGFLPWLIGHTGTEVVTLPPIPDIKTTEEQFETGTWMYPEEQPDAFPNGFHINYRAIAALISVPNPTPGEPPIIPPFSFTISFSADNGDGISIGSAPDASPEPVEPPDFTYVGTAASDQNWTATVDVTNRIITLS